MTPTQERILGYLVARSPAWINGYELRDECIPGRDVKNIHFHVWKLRREGVSIESYTGPRGGYRVPA